MNFREPDEFNTSTEAQWWEAVYPCIVRLERLMTPDPVQFPREQQNEIVTNLLSMEEKLQHVYCSHEVQGAHEKLMHAAKYMRMCYEEHLNHQKGESEYYHYQAVMLLSKLHMFLVQHNLLKS